MNRETVPYCTVSMDRARVLLTGYRGNIIFMSARFTSGRLKARTSGRVAQLGDGRTWHLVNMLRNRGAKTLSGHLYIPAPRFPREAAGLLTETNSAPSASAVTVLTQIEICSLLNRNASRQYPRWRFGSPAAGPKRGAPPVTIAILRLPAACHLTGHDPHWCVQASQGGTQHPRRR